MLSIARPVIKYGGIFLKGEPSLSQTISDAGFPEASHFTEIFRPSIASNFVGKAITWGGTVIKNNVYHDFTKHSPGYKQTLNALNAFNLHNVNMKHQRFEKSLYTVTEFL